MSVISHTMVSNVLLCEYIGNPYVAPIALRNGETVTPVQETIAANLTLQTTSAESMAITHDFSDIFEDDVDIEMFKKFREDLSSITSRIGTRSDLEYLLPANVHCSIRW